MKVARVLICFAVFAGLGCQSDAVSQSDGWGLGQGDGGESRPDVSESDDTSKPMSDVALDDVARSDVRADTAEPSQPVGGPLQIAGTTWRRYGDAAYGEQVRWERFEADGSVSRRLEIVIDGERRGVEELDDGSWSMTDDRSISISYGGDQETTQIRVPRTGFLGEGRDIWYSVPDRDASENMRWSPWSYVATDDSSRRFSGTHKVDFGAREFPGPTLEHVTVDLDFDRPVDELQGDGNCSVELSVTARGRWSDEPTCKMNRSRERDCRVVESDVPNADKISLGYGTSAKAAAKNWADAGSDPSDEDGSCEAALRLLHSQFVPLFYRYHSQPNVLFSATVDAGATRWIRHRTDAPLPSASGQ